MVSGCGLCVRPPSGMALSHRQLMAQLSARASGLPDDPPDLAGTAGSAHDPEDMLQRLSQMCSPIVVTRSQAATVNAAAADRGSPTPRHAFRRLDSMDSAQSLTPGSRFDSFGTPPVQGVETTAQLWTEDRRALEVFIHKEKTRDHENWEPDLLSQEGRLQRRLAKLRLEMDVMAGDGNCMFRAISHELWGTPRFHPNIRRKAVRWMKDHADNFAPFLGESFQGYAAAMGREGTWGDELTLRAVSDAYGIIVNVVTSDQHNWFQRYKPEQVMVPREVFLTYIAPVHYNGIRRAPAALDKAAAEEHEIVSLPEHPKLRAQRQSAEAAAAAAVAAVDAEREGPRAGRGDRGLALQSVAERPSCEAAPEACNGRPGAAENGVRDSTAGTERPSCAAVPEAAEARSGPVDVGSGDGAADALGAAPPEQAAAASGAAAAHEQGGGPPAGQAAGAHAPAGASSGVGSGDGAVHAGGAAPPEQAATANGAAGAHAPAEAPSSGVRTQVADGGPASAVQAPNPGRPGGGLHKAVQSPVLAAGSAADALGESPESAPPAANGATEARANGQLPQHPHSSPGLAPPSHSRDEAPGQGCETPGAAPTAPACTGARGSCCAGVTDAATAICPTSDVSALPDATAKRFPINTNGSLYTKSKAGPAELQRTEQAVGAAMGAV